MNGIFNPHYCYDKILAGDDRKPVSTHQKHGGEEY